MDATVISIAATIKFTGEIFPQEEAFHGGAWEETRGKPLMVAAKYYGDSFHRGGGYAEERYGAPIVSPPWYILGSLWRSPPKCPRQTYVPV